MKYGTKVQTQRGFLLRNLNQGTLKTNVISNILGR